jgi:hypothetical protein
MKKIKHLFTYVVGAMAIGGASLYFSLSKENKQKVKDFMGNMLTKDDMCK